MKAAVATAQRILKGNDIGSIDVGFLVRKKVKIEGVMQLGATETFIETARGDSICYTTGRLCC